MTVNEDLRSRIEGLHVKLVTLLGAPLDEDPTSEENLDRILWYSARLADFTAGQSRWTTIGDNVMAQYQHAELLESLPPLATTKTRDAASAYAQAAYANAKNYARKAHGIMDKLFAIHGAQWRQILDTAEAMDSLATEEMQEAQAQARVR